MSDFFQIAVLFIAILLFSILAFKRISAVILGPLLAIFIILSTRMPIFQTMLENYMKTAADYVHHRNINIRGNQWIRSILCNLPNCSSIV